MNDDPIVLDTHRDVTAQEATDMRRKLAEVQAEARAEMLAEAPVPPAQDTLPQDAVSQGALSQEAGIARSTLLKFAPRRRRALPRDTRLVVRPTEERGRLFHLNAPRDDHE